MQAMSIAGGIGRTDPQMMISLDKIDVRGLTLDSQCDSIGPNF